MAHEAAPDKPLEKEKLYSEYDTKLEMDKTYQEEVPEGQMAVTVFAIGSFISASYLNRRNDILTAFKHINDPNFEFELLKVRYPTRFKSLTEDFELAKKEIEKQRKSERGKKREYAQAGIGPFKRFNEKIDFDTFDHKEQAIKLAASVQNKINADQWRGKIEKTAEIYGLSSENKTKLERGIAGWRKRNPEAHIDEYFQSFGQRLQYLQQPAREGFSKRRRKEKERTKALYKELDAVRMAAVKANRQQIIAAQTEIKDLLDPKKAIISADELKERIYRVLHTTVITTAAPSIDAATVTTGLPVYQPTEKISIALTSPKTTITEGPTIPKTQPPAALPTKIISGTPLHRFDIMTSKPVTKISTALKTVAPKLSFLSNLSLGKLVGKGASFLAGKLGLGAATGGIYTAASLIAGLLGIDLDGFILKAALFAVAVPIGVLILSVFIIGSNSNKFFPLTADTAEPMRAANIQNKNLSWGQFEKGVLGAEIRNDKWAKFESKFLVMTGP